MAAFASAALAAPPPGYYDGAEGLAGPALEAALHDIIDGHTVVAYSWPPFLDIDEAPANASHVELIYTDGTRSKSLNGGAVGDWNREHLWPRSYGIFNDDGADASDLFNLRPSDVQVNSERGNLPFDSTAPGGSLALQFDAPGCSKDSDSWEPRDDEKGDIARACFYMDVRYDGSDPATRDLELSDSPSASAARFGHLLELLRWHRADPPDARERARNDAIHARWQHNRNPFIDRPEFAGQLFLAGYPQLDDDSDGLPDWWEYRALGGMASDAFDDPDGDRASNLLEFASGTHADRPSSRPAPRIASDGSDLLLTYRWADEAGASGYAADIETSPSLAPGSWVPAAAAAESEVQIEPGVAEITVRIAPPDGAFARFYRLAVGAP